MKSVRLFLATTSFLKASLAFSQTVQPSDFSSAPNSSCAIKVAKFINNANSLSTCQDAKNVVDLLTQTVNEGCALTIGMANQSHLLYINKATVKITAFVTANKCDDKPGATLNSNSKDGLGKFKQDNSVVDNIVPSAGYSQITNGLLQMAALRIARQEAQRQELVSQQYSSNKYSEVMENQKNEDIKGDILIFKNKTQMKVIIIEIKGELIRYKNAALPDGPTFVVNKKDVEKMIKTD